MESTAASIADEADPFACFLASNEPLLGGGTPAAAEQVVAAKSGILAPATDEVAAAITVVVAAVGSSRGGRNAKWNDSSQGASGQDNSIIGRSSDR